MRKGFFYFKNSLFYFLIIFIFGFFVNYFPLNIFAQSVSELQKEISNRNLQIKQLQAEIDAYNNKVASTQEEAKTLKTAIAKLESQKGDLQNQILLTNLKINEIEDNILDTKSKIDKNQISISLGKSALIKTLSEINKLDNEPSSLLINLIKYNDKMFSDLLNNNKALTDFNDSLKTKLEYINNTIKELDEHKNEYQKQKDEFDKLSSDLSLRKDLISQNQKEQNNLLVVTKNNEASYKKIISERENKVKDLQSEINNFEAKIKYVLDQNKLPASGSGLFWPLDKFVLTQHFGNTEFASTGAYNGNGHNGIDLAVSVGTKVKAAQNGIIVDIGDTDKACAKASYGKWILIKHNNGLATIYGHLSAINVVKGQAVIAGDQIGLSGNTGYSTGPHLHFTVVAADAVKIFGPTEYRSKTCGTYMVMPYAALNAYLNPLNYLPKR